jgi:hypothetical protein
MFHPHRRRTTLMASDRFVLDWGGEPFQFTRMAADGVPTWAVTRRGEFVGTLECSGVVADEELRRLAGSWLDGLFGRGDRRRPQSHSTS